MLITRMALTAEEEAYQYVHKAIRLGWLRAGERLVPEAIASEIGTSRMPVRSALRRLAAEGLVEIRANRSAVVRGLNQQEMQEVFQMRSVLEGLAMRNAVANMGPEHVQRLVHKLDQLELGTGDDTDWTAAHRDFHAYLCGFCRQPRLLQQIADLHSVVEPYMRLWSAQPGGVGRTREAHQELIDALKTADADHCEAVMRRHVMNTVTALYPFLIARN
ncbi:GntR family transcriptional regulator [Orrella sp. JC864]|uniref:GntR family transcriptional regulator n=1 Tax=Orrella sp. JC864 TaxID=3120298 RepID=UPI0012BCE896